MSSVINGLCIAFCWGLADVQSSRTNFHSMKISVIAQGFGFLTLTLVGIIWFHATLSTNFSFGTGTGLGLLLFLGILSALSYFCLYRALHLAKTSSIGTISAIIAANAGVTVLLSYFVTPLDVSQITTVGIMMSGILVITKQALPSRVDAKQHTLLPPAILWALAASLCLGTFNFGVGMLEQNTNLPTTNTFLILLGIRAFSFLVLALFLAMHAPIPEQQNHHRLHHLFCAASTGILEAIGLMLFSFATQTTNIGIIATLSSCSILIPLGYGYIVQRNPLSLPGLGGFGLLFLSFLRLSYPALSLEIVLSCTAFCSSLIMLPALRYLLSPALDTLRKNIFAAMDIGSSIPAIETYPTIEIQQIQGIIRLKTTHTTQTLSPLPYRPSRSRSQTHPYFRQEKILSSTPSSHQKPLLQTTLPFSKRPYFWIMLSFILSLLLMTIIVGLATFSSFPVQIPF